MDDRDDNEEDEEEDMNGEENDLVTSVMDQETKEHRIQVRSGWSVQWELVMTSSYIPVLQALVWVYQRRVLCLWISDQLDLTSVYLSLLYASACLSDR